MMPPGDLVSRERGISFAKKQKLFNLFWCWFSNRNLIFPNSTLAFGFLERVEGAREGFRINKTFRGMQSSYRLDSTRINRQGWEQSGSSTEIPASVCAQGTHRCQGLIKHSLTEALIRVFEWTHCVTLDAINIHDDLNDLGGAIKLICESIFRLACRMVMKLLMAIVACCVSFVACAKRWKDN